MLCIKYFGRWGSGWSGAGATPPCPASTWWRTSGTELSWSGNTVKTLSPYSGSPCPISSRASGRALYCRGVQYSRVLQCGVGLGAETRLPGPAPPHPVGGRPQVGGGVRRTFPLDDLVSCFVSPPTSQLTFSNNGHFQSMFEIVKTLYGIQGWEEGEADSGQDGAGQQVLVLVTLYSVTV